MLRVAGQIIGQTAQTAGHYIYRAAGQAIGFAHLTRNVLDKCLAHKGIKLDKYANKDDGSEEVAVVALLL